MCFPSSVFFLQSSKVTEAVTDRVDLEQSLASEIFLEHLLCARLLPLPSFSLPSPQGRQQLITHPQSHGGRLADGFGGMCTLARIEKMCF